MHKALLHLLPDILVSLALPCLLIILALAARRIPRRPIKAFQTLGSAWVSLSRRPVVAAALLCGIQLAGVGLQAVVSGPPIPITHDEFSYLIAGETFASGRITNPTHPMWVHFETPHVIQTPTRMSKYPPGQAVFLAAGYLLGHPWIGVILSTLVMIVLVYWAARQWMAPWWALVAGVFGLGMVLGTYWTGSYWGGAVNASAGALVTGSAGLLRRRSSQSLLAIYALGACGCALTRPYEGLVLVVLFSSWLIWRAGRSGNPRLTDYVRHSLAAVMVTAVFAAAFLFYNYRTTGKSLTTPYVVASREYLASKMFVFQKHPPVPEYHHLMLETIFVGLRRTELPVYWRLYSHLDGFRAIYAPRLVFPLFLVVFISALRGLQIRSRPVVLIAAGGVAAILMLPFIHPHYYAPFAVCMILSITAGLRGLRAWRIRGVRPGWVILVLCLGYYAGHLANGAHSGSLVPARADRDWSRQRQRLISELPRAGQKHLVLVRYAENHNWHNEWVYNAADIDGAPVVWAREMDPANDARIIRYFADRKIWLLEADAAPPRLTAHPQAAGK